MSLLRPTLLKALRPPKTSLNYTISPLTASRHYASNRRQVTVVNDDGRVNWSDLSTKEKAARTTQQSFNLTIVVVGVVMTGAVAWFLFEDVFSPNSKTSYFNRAVKRIKASPECIEALGPANQMVFYGESVRSSFRRARIAEPTPTARVTKDERTGVEEISMRFLVGGEKAEGWCVMRLQKAPGELEYEWVTLALDVEGGAGRRIWLEGTERGVGGRKGSTKLLGINWR